MTGKVLDRNATQGCLVLKNLQPSRNFLDWILFCLLFVSYCTITIRLFLFWPKKSINYKCSFASYRAFHLDIHLNWRIHSSRQFSSSQLLPHLYQSNTAPKWELLELHQVCFMMGLSWECREWKQTKPDENALHVHWTVCVSLCGFLFGFLWPSWLC